MIAITWTYPVLATVSHSYSRYRGRSLTRYSPVRHSTQVPKNSFAFDLHVLSTPPAFVLSQDQTLQFDILNWLLSYFFWYYFLPCYSHLNKTHLKQIPSQQKYQRAGYSSYDDCHTLRARLLFAAIQFSRIIHHRPDHTSSGTAAPRLPPRQAQHSNWIWTPCQ